MFATARDILLGSIFYFEAMLGGNLIPLSPGRVCNYMYMILL
jgi:hypothetical protein